MVQKSRPRFLFQWNWASALGVASALATVLLVLTFFLQFQPAVMSTAAQQAAAPRQAASDQAGTQQEAAPPIIVWNTIPKGMGMGGGGPARGSDFAQPTVEALTAPQPYETPAANGAPAPAATPAPAMPALPATAPAQAAAPTRPASQAGSGIQPTATAGLALKSAPATASGAPLADQTGPILGVASTEDRGKMVVPTLPPVDTYGLRASEAPESGGVRTAQILLAVVAVLTGVAALFLWWRARH
jgi:hypothetical protein